MLQVTNWLLVTFYLAPNHFVIEIQSTRDIAFEFLDTMNSLSGKGWSVGSELAVLRHWPAEFTCLFTPQSSTVNSYICVLVTVTYYVISINWDCSIIFINVNSISYSGTFGVVTPTFTVIHEQKRLMTYKVTPISSMVVLISFWLVIISKIKMLFYLIAPIRQY